MLFIFGINQREKQLDFAQAAVCPCCGRYGHISVWVRYSYFMLFFIPIFKWGRRYFARMDCCGKAAPLDEQTGRAIERGEIDRLDVESLNFGGGGSMGRACPVCGFTTFEDFAFCPKCGRPME